MANPYNANQQWTQNQMHYEPQQMNQNYDYSPQNGQGQQQGQLDPNAFVDTNAYFGNVQQQQLPQNPQPNTSPPLHGGFNMSQPNNNVQQSQGGMGGGFTFGAQQHSSPPLNRSAGAPYRTAPTNFNFSTVGSGPAATSAQGSSVHNTPANLFQNQLPQASGSSAQHQQNYYNNDGGEPISKRHHGLAFDPNQESDEIITQEQKDAKAKLSRACARCKNLKVRCEAKTETEPCIRCYKAGQECVTPGRKIRRTPPKREHLIAEIHSQKEKIEGLLRRLEELEGTGGKANGKRPDDGRLTPTSTGGSFYDESETGNTSQDMDGDNTFPESGHAASGSNKAVEEWIAKARESLHEFGAFVGIGGAGMPKSYLVGEDFEDSDDDQEYTDAPEELEGEADDDRIGVAVEAPDGEEMPYDPTRPGQANSLRHKSSSSSMGTVGTSNTANTGLPRPPKRNGANNDNAKSASIPVEASPFGLFGKLSLVGGPRSRAGSAEPEEEDRGAGIAREDFFKSTPAPNALGRRLESAQHQTPTILTRGIITPQEAEALFKIYFENMNLSVSLLDPVLYTAQRTFYRSPFLFTVICAIASRFYSPRPDLYAKIMQQAQHAAGMALISGNKNVEMCQAYILLSLYPVPARKWEDQRSWLYLGLAIRTATDLNLHLPTTAKPLNENHAREMLNRTRVWMNCLNLDRSTGSQYGKPPIISPRDYIANHSDRWWATSPYNMKHFDIQICAYNAELKVMTAFIAKIYSDPDHPTGLNKEVDFEGIATETDDELKALAEKWFAELDQTDMSDPQNSFRTGLLRLAFSYSRLVALSYGFQHAFGKTDGVDENPFLMRCLKAASDVVDSVVNDICRPEQLHYFRHGPEAQSVFVTFASAFLVKLLQPKFASYLTSETRVEIRTLVQSVIDLLGSPAVAIDDRHGPKLYSRFLAKLLAKPMARINPLSPGPGSTASAYAPLPRIRQATYPVTSPSSGSTRSQRSLPTATFDSSTFQIPATVYNHPSPETSNSLSPPATETALSFDSFAPVGPTDPFATETAATVAATNASAQNINNMMMEGFFQPSLPFDDHIVQSLQSLTDPSGWQDISLPGFNWMAQFQQNFGLDLNNGTVYDQNMDFNYNPGANGPAGQ